MNKYIAPKKQKQNKTKTKQIDIQANKQTKKQRSSICKRMETYIHLKHFIKSWAFQYILFSFFFFPVDGNWGEWSQWSTCTKTCKYGKQYRKRECNSPASKYGGKKCVGQPSETQSCNEKVPCPG